MSVVSSSVFFIIYIGRGRAGPPRSPDLPRALGGSFPFVDGEQLSSLPHYSPNPQVSRDVSYRGAFCSTAIMMSAHFQR